VADWRTGKRFPLELNATIRGVKTTAKLEGKTADLSAAGVFIFADGKFDVGSPIEFDITLPAEFIGAKKDVKIRCQGRVVRAGDHPDRETGKGKTALKKKTGVACVIDSYEFVRK
jgi:hypothetical protein